MSVRVLIVGQSARAAAASAARAGFDVTAIDAFADADRHPAVQALTTAGRFTPRRVVEMATAIDTDAVAYLSPFENYPGAVAALSARRALWGNAPAVLRAVRNPQVLQDALRRHGLPTPGDAGAQMVAGRWLLKPLRSGGGHGIRPWPDSAVVPRGYYRQPFVAGPSWSITFIAAGGVVTPLGLSRQLIGDQTFGATGFGYCGNIAEPCTPGVGDAALTLARVVAEEFSLVGVNGIDFIVRGGEPVAIEVNPRWSASVELFDRRSVEPLFGLHAAACAEAVVPGRVPVRPSADRLVSGKAIIFARHAVTVGDTAEWIDEGIGDVPRPGQKIPAGRPVCTVFASAADGASCHALLVGRASAVYARLNQWRRRVA